MYNCPQCGLPTETLHEGYCEICFNQNYEELYRHNSEYDRWLRLNDEMRADEIKRAMRLSHD